MPIETLDPQAMLVFAAIARAGGVRGAAAALGVPRSTVSRRLAELEESVGAQLVVRTARRFALTEVGAALFARSEELEELLRSSRDVLELASAAPSGVLRVAAAPVLGEEILPGVIAELLAAHPRLSVDVRMSVEYVDLRDGTVDVALRAWPLEDASDLFATRLGVSVTGCYASPAYAKARGLPSTPAQLAEHACIAVGSTRSWELRAEGESVRVAIDGRVRVDGFALARSLALRGVGILRTARMYAAPFVESGELVPVLEAWWPETPIHAVHAGPSPAVPKVRAFIDAARLAVARAL